VNEVGRAYGTHGRGEKSVQGFDGKAGRKETTCKTKGKMGDGIRMDLWETAAGGGGVFTWLRIGTGGGLL
jgi:hypothetical protein